MYDRVWLESSTSNFESAIMEGVDSCEPFLVIFRCVKYQNLMSWLMSRNSNYSKTCVK